MWDYISLGSIAVILGLIYVSSVALYLYKKRATANTMGGEEAKHGGGIPQGDKVGPKAEIVDERPASGGIGRPIPEEGKDLERCLIIDGIYGF